MSMIRTELPIKFWSVRPKVKGQSDKYSRYLFNWLVKHGHQYGAGVYCAQKNVFDGTPKPFDFVTADRPDIYIGFILDGELNAANIRSIQHGNMQATCQVFGDNWLNITEWFWTNYQKIGRCLLNGHDTRLMDDENRFTMDGDLKRTCNWCGVHQQLHIKEVVVKQKEWTNG